jgi:GGDEF domain-containing protein
MFGCLVVLAAAGAAECLRGELLTRRPAWSLAFVLALQALYYVSRTTALVVVGPDSALFLSWFGTVTTSVLTVVLIIVATVATSVLLAERAPDRARPIAADDQDDIVDAAGFAASLQALARRAAWRRELVAVVSVRIDDLEQISTAFGGDTARAVMQAWNDAVRRYAPAQAVVGTDGESGMVIAAIAESPADARRRASAVYRGVFDELGRVSGGVIPVLGVGVGLSSTAGYDADALIETARDAARRAAASVESSVLIGDA